MTLAEKIVERRRMLGLSQEELAEKLGVSRQSVSKWELGDAVPETDKIVAMSEIFGVSCDYLLKDNAEAGEFTPPREIGAGEVCQYLDAYAKKLLFIAVGVGILIISPLALIMLGAAFEAELVSEAVMIAVGLSVLFALAALGVALIIVGNMSVGAYSEISEKKTPLSSGALEAVKKMLDSGRSAYTYAMVCATVMCVVSVIPLILFAVIELPTTVSVWGMVIMFFIVASAVFIFIKHGTYHEECLNLININSEIKNGKSRAKILMENVFWPLTVAVYLGISFLSGRWDITWIIFPIAAALSGCIEALINSKNKND